MRALLQCSPWLCMNCLSLSEKVIFCEETEKGMIELFNDQVPTLLALLVQEFKDCRLLK